MSEYRCENCETPHGTIEEVKECCQCESCVVLKAQLKAVRNENERMTNLLEDVVNELDLSESAIEQHGPMGTAPAELVRLVLAEKDLKIAALKAGLIPLAQEAGE
jgi:hypothetical protein